MINLRNIFGSKQQALPPASQPEQSKEIRLDGWSNIISGLGERNGVAGCNTFVGRIARSPYEADAVYQFSALMARIIDLEPDTCFAKGFGVNEISGDDITSLESYLTRLDTFRKMADAARYARQYGGSIIYMHINDGRKSDEPVNVNNIFAVSRLQVFTFRQVSVQTYGTNIDSEYFDAPEIYSVASSGVTFNVHASRVLHFDAIRVSNDAKRYCSGTRGFTTSIIDQIWDSFSSYGVTNAYFAETVRKLTQGVLKLSNLNEGMKSGTASGLVARLKMLLSSMSTIGDVVVDKDGEDYSVVDRNVTGFDDAANVFVNWLVAESGIPRSLLMGTTDGGISDGNNEGDWKNWAMKCGSAQVIKYEPIAMKLLRYVFASRSSPVNDAPQYFTVLWPPILQMTEKEKAEIYALRATGRGSDVMNGIISTTEARKSDDVIESYHLDADGDDAEDDSDDSEEVSA